MKKPIFKFFLFFIFFIPEIHANDISIHYEKVKDQIKTNKIIKSGDYYFTGSFARYGAIESIDIEKNKTNAINNFLDYLSEYVDWPKSLSDFEKKKKWLSYKSKRQVNLEGLLLVDNGKIGSNYFVVMGIKKELLLKNKVTFDKLERMLNQ